MLYRINFEAVGCGLGRQDGFMMQLQETKAKDYIEQLLLCTGNYCWSLVGVPFRAKREMLCKRCECV